jgi:hypothetical protein
MPIVCSKPQATNLTFNFSTFIFVVNLVLKAHLLIIGLLPTNKSCNSQGPLFNIESYYCFMATFHPKLIIVYSYVIGPFITSRNRCNPLSTKVHSESALKMLLVATTVMVGLIQKLL